MSTPGQSQPDSQGTLAGAGGALIGGGLAELQANALYGFALVFMGVVLVVVRAYWRYKLGIPPTLQMFQTPPQGAIPPRP